MTTSERGAHETAPFTARAAVRTQHGPATPSVRQPDAALMAELPAGHAVLIIQRGPRAGEDLALDTDGTLVGRHTEADICLDHVTVSRRHAEFLPHEGGHMVRDVGSLNGTYVNGQRIDAAVLRTGDEVQIGKYRLTYHLAAPTRGGPAAEVMGRRR